MKTYTYWGALWTVSGGYQLLRTSTTQSQLIEKGISGDGKVMFGYAVSGPNPAFYWTAAGGLTTLGPTSWVVSASNFDGSELSGVSADGPFIWRKSTGLSLLQDPILWMSNDGATTISSRLNRLLLTDANNVRTDIPLNPGQWPIVASQDGSVVVSGYLWSKYGVVSPQQYLTAHSITIDRSSHWAGVSADGKTLIVTTETNTPKSYIVKASKIVPVAIPERYYVAAGSPISVASPGILTNDAAGPNPTAVLVRGPAHALSFHLNADGSFTYQPAPGTYISDTFVYAIHTADGLLTNATSAAIVFTH